MTTLAYCATKFITVVIFYYIGPSSPSINGGTDRYSRTYHETSIFCIAEFQKV